MDNFKVPIEWVDRIFKRLAEAYGDRFALKFTRPSYVEMERTRWQSGLYGATVEEIRHVLDLCKRGIIPEPPNIIEFFHYCKGVRLPSKPKSAPLTPKQTETGKQYIKLIMDKLHGRLDSEGEAALSTLDKQIMKKQEGETKKHWTDD